MDRLEQFAVTAPAGTLKAAPLEVATRWNPGTLEAIEVVVPDGHAGLTGLALALAHQVLVPNTPGQFITSNDEVIHWPASNFPNSGAWSAFVYNTDLFDHVFYVRYLVRELGSGIRLKEPIAPGVDLTIGVGTGDLGGGSGDAGDIGTIILPGDGSGDTGGSGDGTGDILPPDDTGDTGEILPPDDGSGDILPPDDSSGDDGLTDILPPDDGEVEIILPPPPPPPPPPPVAVIPNYGLPADYTPGDVPIFGNPGNLGMLIGTVLGYKLLGQASNSNGTFNNWRFFSNLGNTMDWNFYISGAKFLQWVGPFNLRTGVPGG